MFEWLHVKGTAQMLVELLEGPHYVSWFYRSEHNPFGIGSSRTVIKVRNLLKSLGLIFDYQDETRPRLYLSLTQKGIEIATHLKAIEKILQTP